MKIFVNRIQCGFRGDIIESKSVHDHKPCKCGSVSVDGGTSYLRRSLTKSTEDFRDLSVTDVA